MGGVENSLHALSKELFNAGYKVILICSDRNYVDNSRLDSLEQDKYLTIRRYHYRNGLFGYLGQYRNCVRELIAAQSREGHFDLVVSRSHITTIGARLAGLKETEFIVPSVTMFQDFPNTKVKLKARFLAKYIVDVILQYVGFRVATRLYVYSDSMRRQVRIHCAFPRRVPISVSPGIDRERFCERDWTTVERDAAKTTLDVPVKKKIILCLGRFSNEKQFGLAIQAIAELDEDFLLVLVGGGPEKCLYNELISELKLKDRVIIFPPTRLPEAYYAVSDVFVMSSKYEAFGQTLLEATASGVPVAAFSRASGVKTASEEIYNSFSSLANFAHKLDAKSLADAIRRSVSVDREEFRVEQKKFLAKYSWDRLRHDIERAAGVE